MALEVDFARPFLMERWKQNGSRLKEVGTIAREAISKMLGVPVFLDLRVKVAKDWQRDPKQLNRLGF